MWGRLWPGMEDIPYATASERKMYSRDTPELKMGHADNVDFANTERGYVAISSTMQRAQYYSGATEALRME